MPVQPPHYSVPDWNPSGSTDVNQAMSEWVGSFGAQHQETQEAISRTPFISSTNTQASGVLSSGNPYLTLSVPTLGGEHAHILGHFEFSVEAAARSDGGSTGDTSTAHGSLSVVYPGGKEVKFGSGQQAKLQVSHGLGGPAGTSVTSTQAVRATVSYSWSVQLRQQTGGEHRFNLYTSGQGQRHAAQLVAVIL